MPCRRRFFLPKHSGNRVPQRLDHYSGLTSLQLYRAALRLRRTHWRGAGPVRWLDCPPGVLAFRRGELCCWVNTTGREVALPKNATVLLASHSTATETRLPPDTTVWLAAPEISL